MGGYIAVVDGGPGSYGSWFPDLPGCTAMGQTIETLAVNAREAMRDWASVLTEQGGVLPRPSSPEGLRQNVDVVEALQAGAHLTEIAMV